ncbi:MAG: hypothetical protein BGO59_31305 [Spirosoma sp. 48-14]|nr:MAG: hypothetical protein BGO59_31305 [Spirosoma sp. 48-14]
MIGKTSVVLSIVYLPTPDGKGFYEAQYIAPVSPAGPSLTHLANLPAVFFLQVTQHLFPSVIGQKKAEQSVSELGRCIEHGV